MIAVYTICYSSIWQQITDIFAGCKVDYYRIGKNIGYISELHSV
jgi:hypothetical protein